MMKAAAPITGGINCPPVEPTDSIAAARIGEKPERAIKGMVTMPTATTLLTAAPEIMPNKRGTEDRDLGGAAAEIAHRRHRQIGEIGRAAGAAEHLAHQRERHHDDQRDIERITPIMPLVSSPR